MMTITKYFHHQGNIDALTDRHPAFARFKHSTIRRSAEFKWLNKSTNTIEWQAVISFFGKSGYGKSSTVNAFFGQPILETSDVAACTGRCDCLDFQISDEYFLSFADYPGIGENEYKDKEYLEMYKNFLASSNIVVYVLRADMRDYAIDEQAFKTVFPCDEDKRKVIFAVNCCDKIEPVRRTYSTTPSAEQMKNIEKKLQKLRSIFQPHNPIIPYSAQTTWNLEALAETIVNVAEKVGDITFHASKKPFYSGAIPWDSIRPTRT